MKLSIEAQGKIQSLWWKAHDDYLRMTREIEQGVWDDLSEEHRLIATRQQYNECLIWNEIMSLARKNVDNTSE